MMETVALGLLPGSHIPILAIAGVDHVIHLYAQPEATVRTCLIWKTLLTRI
jgi:hypothetical protein